jgi:DNA-binding NtrC family response regulator
MRAAPIRFLWGCSVTATHLAARQETPGAIPGHLHADKQLNQQKRRFHQEVSEMSTQVMLFNGNSVTRELIALALPPPVFEVYMVAEVPDAIQALHRVSKRAVVIIDYSVTNWQTSALFIQTVAKDADLVSRHTYVLLLSTDETLSVSVSTALNKLSVLLLAKPAAKEQITSVVQIMAQRQLRGQLSGNA